jgi:hypothetical protein
MPPKRTLTEAEENSIVSLYESGETVRSIARVVGTRTSVVTSVLDDRGVEIRTGRAKLTPEQEQEVLRLHDAGHASARIAAMYKITPGTVTRILNRHGVVPQQGRPRGTGWSDSEQQLIVSLYENGVSQQTIAHQIGVSQSVVSRVLQHAGFDTKRTNFPRREEHGMRKGGRNTTDKGYVQVMPRPEDLPYVRVMATGYALEHRLVMGKKLGRPLTDNETVHHIDGNRANNSPENLQLRQGRHGAGVRYICVDCGSLNVVTTEF